MQLSNLCRNDLPWAVLLNLDQTGRGRERERERRGGGEREEGEGRE